MPATEAQFVGPLQGELVCDRVVLLILCATLTACRLNTEPSDPYGDYQLVSYEATNSQQTIPVSLPDYTGSPGDSLRILSGTFSLRADGRWRRERTIVNRRGGLWGSAAAASDSGTFGIISGSGAHLQLMLMILPNQPYEQATTNGKELQEGLSLADGVFIYSRR